MPLSPHEAEWLSLIRYQALSAVELSHQPPHLGGTALNGLQDAVEDVFRRCYRFVIDTALTLGAEDYDFDARAARRQDRILRNYALLLAEPLSVA